MESGVFNCQKIWFLFLNIKMRRRQRGLCGGEGIFVMPFAEEQVYFQIEK